MSEEPLTSQMEEVLIVNDTDAVRQKSVKKLRKRIIWEPETKLNVSDRSRRRWKQPRLTRATQLLSK